MENLTLSAREVINVVEKKGIEKASNPSLSHFLLAMLAGMYIAFGCLTYITVVANAHKFGGDESIAIIVGAGLFITGLIMVIFTGAELFTGNSIMTLGAFRGTVKWKHVFRNWGVVYFGNFVGSMLVLLLFYLTGMLDSNDYFKEVAIGWAEKKVALTFGQAFWRGIMCNFIVVLAVWMSFAAKDAVGKIALMWFPITIFVILGFEHSVANMAIIPLGALAGSTEVDILSFLGNIIPVTLGNIVGGAFIVPVIYFLVYKNVVKSEEKCCAQSEEKNKK